MTAAASSPAGPSSGGELAGRSITLVGGAGFMGHHLALELVRRGAIVDNVDSLQVNNLLQVASLPANSPHRETHMRMIHERLDLMNDAGVNLAPVDARDYSLLSRTLNRDHCKVMIQLAAVAHAGKSNKDPLSTFDHSLRTLENALDCARGYCEHFIYISSSMVYGNFRTPAVAEDHPLEPLGIYGALKLSGEKLVIAYNQVFDLPYTIIRPSALYGPRCISRRVAQIYLENAHAGQPLKVEGDGTERLDFTYIDDLVDGICRVIQNPASKNETFNLTYGESRSINDLVDAVRSEFADVAVEFTPRDSLSPVRGTLDVSKARDLLGYSPRYPLEKAFPRYAQWYREFMAKGGHGRTAASA